MVNHSGLTFHALLHSTTHACMCCSHACMCTHCKCNLSSGTVCVYESIIMFELTSKLYMYTLQAIYNKIMLMDTKVNPKKY